MGRQYGNLGSAPGRELTSGDRHLEGKHPQGRHHLTVVVGTDRAVRLPDLLEAVKGGGVGVEAESMSHDLAEIDCLFGSRRPNLDSHRSIRG